MPIADTKDIGDHTVASARPSEVVHCALEVKRALVMLLKPVVDNLRLEGACHAMIRHLDVPQCRGVLHKLHHACLPPGGDTSEGDHPKVVPSLQPEPINDPNHLESEHVLPQ